MPAERVRLKRKSLHGKSDYLSVTKLLKYSQWNKFDDKNVILIDKSSELIDIRNTYFH